MNYYIVTGASRGLGEAIVKELLNPNNVIIYLSRTSNPAFDELAASKKTAIFFEECDLSDIDQIRAVMKKVFSKIDAKLANKITLINNAGMVDPIKYVGEADEKNIVSAVKLNLLAPMIMSDYFIKESKGYTGQAVIVNITSGAANRPTAGWSTYCSVKAGLNMFTNTIGVEQGERENNVIAIAFSPGIMDTQMQSTIRTADRKDFSSSNQFKEYHEKGLLRAPGFVAHLLIKLLSSSLENGRVYDIKEFI
ncbi:(S)-benzoin forming benzil reductase [Metabacillus sediminilitoris]|uniref:(S)-benzoin forming benzil reductase n=1 Tax=Metabacillus sediminilitoris TaxID=2567941 RepID=A0A4S4C211_9BACI|nr:(S)-benzoin forming benzil reductase [Metabacillus sediminilitoris]QGQ47852.1 (S)-benzoin forming benzil reductase [Metabacillus sediminilitoris]THF81035.1 (S)-benzoin forming benzil reductase [Metabacillus sediminilitoris]